MKPEILVELIYTVTALIAGGAGAIILYRKKSSGPLFVKMVICMLGCRFLQGFLELMLLKINVYIDTFSISGIGQIAQLLFLICANCGAINSLCDDGSKAYLKYRIIAGIVPLGVLIYYVINAGKIASNTAQIFTIFVPLIIMLIALYYHIKHLIIKDVEDGIVRRLRLYNLIGVANCAAIIVEWFSDRGSVGWYIAMSAYILVSLTILPALARSVKKWRE